MTLRIPATILPCVILLVGMTPAQAPLVNATTPIAESVGAPTVTPITCTFAAPVDPATVTGSSVQVFGRWSGVHSGTLQLENSNQTVVFTPTRQFVAGEQVLVTITTAVTSPGGTPMGAPFSWYFWTETLPTSLTFSAPTMMSTQTGGGFTRPYGVFPGDLDGDGFLDLTVPCEGSDDLRIWMNDGTGNFSGPPIIMPLANNPSPSEGCDLNEDGAMDVVALGVNGTLGVFLNDGNGTLLPPTTYPTGASLSIGAVVFDVNNDAHQDVVITQPSNSTMAVFLGNGNGTLQAATTFDAGGNREWSVFNADFNRDGLLDMLIGFNTSTSYNGGVNSRIRTLINDGNGGFTIGSQLTGLSGVPRQVVAGDVNGDGLVDAAAALANGQTLISFGDGLGGLGPPQIIGTVGHSIAVDLGDLDGDGDLDVVTSNFGAAWEVYQNPGNGIFPVMPQTLPAVAAPGCAAILDLSGDGRMSVLGIDELGDSLSFFSPTLNSVEPGHATAQLTVNGLTGTPGFNGAPAQLVSVAGASSVALGGVSGSTAILYVGLPLQPGMPFSWGTINLDVAAFFPLPIFTSTIGAPASSASALGTATFTPPVPLGLPVGVQYTLQGVVFHPGMPGAGFLTTNPTTILTGP